MTVGLEVALGNHLSVVGGDLVHPGLGTRGQGWCSAPVLGIEVLAGRAVSEVPGRSDLVGALLGRGDETGVPGQVGQLLELTALVLDVDGVLLVSSESGGGRDEAESGCQSRSDGETHPVELELVRLVK